MSKARWYEIAQGEKGVQENPDPDRDNPRIVEYFGTTDFWNKDDDEAWCSAFANWCFAQAGIEGTHSARARSWHEKKWGKQLDTPREGCLVVMRSPLNPADPVRGHVGFFAADQDDDTILVLGGNQGRPGAVNNKPFPKQLVLSYRWPSAEMLQAASRPEPEKPAVMEVKVRGRDFTAELAREYEEFFATCRIRDARLPEVDAVINKVASAKTRYASVGNQLKIPWFLVAVIHNMESSCNFNAHLHNGDPLTDFTVHVPAGRPQTGSPPFSWEESAMDALAGEKFTTWTDWSLPGLLYKLERYNGWGYRKRGYATPYLWSFSNHYTKGKFVKDGVFDPDATSRQVGAAVILKRMLGKGVLTLADLGLKPDTEAFPSPRLASPVKFQYSHNLKSQWGEDLQGFLNLVEWINLDEDGYPGDDTSMAFRQMTGHFLPGDEREGYLLISYAPDAEPWELVEEFQKLLNTYGAKQIKVTGVAGEETSDAFKELTGYYLYGDPRKKG